MMTETRWLTLTPLPDNSVAMQCHFDGNAIGLAENTGLAIRMSPAEAREIAQKLARNADEAEAAQRPM